MRLILLTKLILLSCLSVSASNELPTENTTDVNVLRINYKDMNNTTNVENTNVELYLCVFQNYEPILFASKRDDNLFKLITDICQVISDDRKSNYSNEKIFKELERNNFILNKNERIRNHIIDLDFFKQEIFKFHINNCFIFNHLKYNTILICLNKNEFNPLENESVRNEFVKTGLYEIYDLYKEQFETICFIKNVGVLVLLSSLFLVITIIVYILLPELRSSVYGKCVLFYLVSLTVSFVSFGTRLTFSGQLDQLTCYIVGFLFHFSWIASFTWQSVMCLDILIALSVLKWPAGSRNGDVKKLIFYVSFAYGLPGLFTLTTVMMQFGPLLGANSDWNPNIGGRYCFFQNVNDQARIVRWLYFSGLNCFLILINVTMFIWTAVLIHRHSLNAKKLRGSESRRCSTNGKTRENELYEVHLKLFFVMGTNWILEVIILIKDNVGVTNGWFFRAIDYFNASIGIVLFFVLVCKPKQLKKLKSKFIRNSSENNVRKERRFLANIGDKTSSWTASVSTLEEDISKY